MPAPPIPYILTQAGRYADLMKQGFMKPLKVRKAPKVIPVVACYGCIDWHRQGKHTVQDAAARRASFKDYKDNLIRCNQVPPPKMERV